MHIFNFTTFLALTFQLIPTGHSSILGSYHHTLNAPGFIDLEKESAVYWPLSREKSKYEKRDDLDRRSPSQIIKDLLEHSDLDDLQKKVEHYLNETKVFECTQKIESAIKKGKASSKAIELYNQLGNLACQKLNLDLNGDLDGFQEKFSTDRVSIGTGFIFSKIKKVQSALESLSNDFNWNDEKGQILATDILEIYEVWESLKNDDVQRGKHKSELTKSLEKFFNTLAKHELKSGNSESSNLLIPSQLKDEFPGQQFFSPENLKDPHTLELLRGLGLEVSDLNPPSTGLWRRPEIEISKFDTRNYNRGDLSSLTMDLSLEDAEKIVDPNNIVNVVYNEQDILGGASPKFDVKYKKTKFKLKFVTDKWSTPTELNIGSIPTKWMLGMEVNVEGVVNNIAAALGFSVDPTYYKKAVRLYFPKEAYESEESWQSYYHDFIENVDSSYKPLVNPWSAFTDVREDEEGKKYILVKNVSLEKKSSELSDTNLGLFAKDSFGRDFRRDHRAMALFLAFVADGDIKNANAKMKLVPTSIDPNDYAQYKVVYSASDMGSAFGQGFPNNYLPNFVEKYAQDESGYPESIKIHFQAIYKLSLLEIMTMEDARWLAKMLAQLTPNQVYNAFRVAGGYPNVVSVFYTESFLKRRDQLLEALGLMGTKIKTASNKIFHIQPLSQIQDPDDFTLYDRYESNRDLSQYTKFGLLVDPNNDLFDAEEDAFFRYWDSYIGFKTLKLDNKAAKEFKSAILTGIPSMAYKMLMPLIADNIRITNSGIDLKTSDFSLYNFCGGERCFAQGTNIGLDGFVPGHFVVENPFYNEKDKSSDRYWMVEIARLGMLVGQKGPSALESLGINLSDTVADAFAWGEISFGVEYARIHAVKDYATAKAELETQKLSPVRYINSGQDFLERMAPGDILITSTFAGLEGALRVNYPIFYLLNAQAQVGAERVMLSRTITMKEDNNKALVTWQTIQDNAAKLSGGLGLAILNFSKISGEIKSLKRLDRTYKFDLSSPPQLDMAAQAMKSLTPKVYPETYKLRTDFLNLKQRKISATFLALTNVFELRKRKIQVINDFASDEEEDKAYLVYEKQNKIIDTIDFMPVQRDIITTKAVLNQKNELFASFKFDFHLPGATRDVLLKFYHRYEGLFPKDFAAFDLETINFYIGPVSMRSELVINEAGIAELLSGDLKNKVDLCRVYAMVNEINNEMEVCQKLTDKNPFSVAGANARGAREFIENFQEAQEAYQKLRHVSSIENKRQAYRLMKKIVELLSSGKKYRRTLDTLLTFISEKNFYREANIDATKLESLTGKNFEIKISDKNKGGFSPDSTYSIENPHEYIDSFATTVLETMGSLLKAPLRL